MATDTLERAASLVSALKLEEGFHPQELRSENESGLSPALIEDLILKYLSGVGSASGRAIADQVCMPLVVLEDRYAAMRPGRTFRPSARGCWAIMCIGLPTKGVKERIARIRACAYAGPAPVPLEDYANSVRAQNIRSEKPRRKQLEARVFRHPCFARSLGQLGPAINAGRGMFIYGPPGNGKTTIAQRLTRCFGQTIFVPHAIVEDGQIIKLFDAACHQQVRSSHETILRNAEFDRRWVTNSAAHSRGWRRADDGQFGAEAQRGFQCQRGLIATEEQLRLLADRRFRTAARSTPSNC